MQPETVLAFDTSAAHCAAALLLPSGQVLLRQEAMLKGQAERLLPLLEALLAEAGLNWGALTLLAVGTGPGNFTGVRISVAAARGLALALNIPAIGVTSLQALAFGHSGPLLVAQDARRGAAYVQAFTPQSAAALVDAPALPAGLSLPASSHVVGDLAESYATALGLPTLPPRYPLAEAIARQALLLRDRPDLPRPAPFYLRPADAAPSSDPPPVILDA